MHQTHTVPVSFGSAVQVCGIGRLARQAGPLSGNETPRNVAGSIGSNDGSASTTTLAPKDRGLTGTMSCRRHLHPWHNPPAQVPRYRGPGKCVPNAHRPGVLRECGASVRYWAA